MTYHTNIQEAIPIEKIKQERLNHVLVKAGIYLGSGNKNEMDSECEVRISKYQNALTISTKGYSVWLKRDIDEIYINNYNPKWIKAWNGNMDMQPCSDYFGVITYVTDYYMKDESGTVGIMKEVLQNSPDETLRKKMQLVKNAFLTSRQAGESEVYYKLLPQLHFSQSNIGAIFLPTGFKKNRSRFLKEIPQEAKHFYGENSLIEIEGKEGKFYVEKVSLLDKWFCRPTKLENLRYSQFGKMYEHTQKSKVPKNYNKDVIKEEKDLSKEEKKKLQELDFIIEPYKKLGERKVLPQYIELKMPGGTQWMKKRKLPLVIRFHKFNKTKDPHQYFYSQMQLYYPHRNDEELYPDDYNKCKQKYLDFEHEIQDVRSKIMPHYEKVIEMREKAEEFLSNIGDEMDPNKEQENAECEAEGVKDHPLTMSMAKRQTIIMP